MTLEYKLKQKRWICNNFGADCSGLNTPLHVFAECFIKSVWTLQASPFQIFLYDSLNYRVIFPPLALLLSSGAQMTRKTSLPLKSPSGLWRTLFNSSAFLPSLGCELQAATMRTTQRPPYVSTGRLWCFHGCPDSREGLWPLWGRRSGAGRSAWCSRRSEVKSR